MLRKILKIAVLLVLGWILYVQFWGTTEQKTARKTLFENVKKTGKSLGEIAKTEREKLRGKSFKEALGKVGESIDKLKDDTKNLGSNVKDKVGKIEKTKNDIDNLLEKLKLKKTDEVSTEEEEAVQKKVKSLNEMIEEVAKELESAEG